eukprot:TRINITY_DN6072_c0_g1_i2.p1 TRINITY_DN6072_c0_g1~~TRINITY_DN6072_c0_g1_i2.p1  ORF type:complete len:203 (-),score=54.53 TRINITY_DN6072_c0_g1_i2:105-713(-)
MYKRITIANSNQSLIIGGEPIEWTEEVHPPQLFRFEPANQNLEAIGEGLPKLGSFVVYVLKQKHIFVIPLTLVGGKIYMADLESEQPSNEAGLEEQKEIKQARLDWKVITLKNPKVYSTQMFAPAWGIDVSDDSLMIMSNKGSLIFNWKEEEITGYATHKQKDEFNDGVYKDDKSIYAFGKQGVHTYSIASNKWSFAPQMPI